MPPARHRRPAAVLCAAWLVLATGCGGGSDPPLGPPPGFQVEDPGAVHVHGLGVNPADGALFIATHTGLFRSAPGSRTSERVAGRYQDTMGFTVVGPDRFLGSGHPDRREGKPPLLGLIRSDDAGRSWRSVSLLGEADFHALEAVGARVYGFDAARGRLLASRDGGRRWAERTAPGAVLDLAVDPDHPDRLVASTERALVSSQDGGRSWRPAGGPGAGLLAWPRRDRLLHLDRRGRLRVSGDGGRRWRRSGLVGGEPAALEGGGDGAVYAALHDGTVVLSRDVGRSWRVRARPSRR